MYLVFPTGVVSALGGAAAETVGGLEKCGVDNGGFEKGGFEKGGVENGGVENAGVVTGTVALDTSEDVGESTGSCRGSNFPWKGRMITGVGSTSAESLVEVKPA